jgi:hypothetical protein
MENVTIERAMTTQEVAARFNELAQQEKWFEIHDELFADNVRSIEPPHSHLKNAEGKAAVRKKGEDIVKRVLDFHGGHTTQPLIAGNHFSVGRSLEVTTADFGRVKIEEIMLYEVKDGQITLEQFFY